MIASRTRFASNHSSLSLDGDSRVWCPRSRIPGFAVIGCRRNRTTARTDARHVVVDAVIRKPDGGAGISLHSRGIAAENIIFRTDGALYSM